MNEIWGTLKDSREKRKEAYLELRNKGDKTQEEAAEAVGVKQNTGSVWESKENVSNIKDDKTNKPKDQRRTVSKGEKKKIVEEHESSSKTQAEIGAEHKMFSIM